MEGRWIREGTAGCMEEGWVRERTAGCTEEGWVREGTAGCTEEGWLRIREDQQGGGHHRPHVVLLRRRETGLRRFLVSVLLLLGSVVLLLIIMVLSAERRRPLPDSQLMMQTAGHSGLSQEQTDKLNPRTMLTVPTANIVIGGYLNWESAIGHVFLHGGFSFSGGNLTVPTSGIYRVFLQITYEWKKNLTCNSKEGLRLSHTVLLLSDEYPANQVLLSAVDFVNCSLSTWRKSLFTAGLFELKANDILRVTSSKPELIVNEESEVFFGAELLPQ